MAQRWPDVELSGFEREALVAMASHSARPEDFAIAVLAAQKAVDDVYGSRRVVLPILDTLNARRVRRFRWYVEEARGKEAEAGKAARVAKRLKPRARRARNVAYRTGDWDREALKPYGDYIRARWRSKELERFREQVARTPFRTKSQFDLAPDWSDRLSHRNASYSLVFGEDVLLPLWRVLRPDSRRRRNEDPMPPVRTAKLVHRIVSTFFEPELVRGLSADAIRKRVDKALKKKVQ